MLGRFPVQAMAGIAVGLAAFRLRGAYFAIGTLAADGATLVRESAVFPLR